MKQQEQENKEKESKFRHLDILGKNFNFTTMQIIVFILICHIYKEWDPDDIKTLNVSFLFFLKNFVAFYFQIILLKKYINNINFLKNKNNNPPICDALYNQIQKKVLNDDKIKEQILTELENEYQQILKEDANKLISEVISKTFQNHSNNNSVNKSNNSENETKKRDLNDIDNIDESNNEKKDSNKSDNVTKDSHEEDPNSLE